MAEEDSGRYEVSATRTMMLKLRILSRVSMRRNFKDVAPTWRMYYTT